MKWLKCLWKIVSFWYKTQYPIVKVLRLKWEKYHDKKSVIISIRFWKFFLDEIRSPFRSSAALRWCGCFQTMYVWCSICRYNKTTSFYQVNHIFLSSYYVQNTLNISTKKYKPTLALKDISIEVQFRLLQSIIQMSLNVVSGCFGADKTKCANNEPSFLCQVIRLLTSLR